MLTLYRPGGSLLHRAPVGAKVLVLAAGTTVLLLQGSPVVLAAALVVVVALWVLAGVPLRELARTVRPLLWLLVVLGVLQVMVLGWVAAAGVVLRLVVLVLLASLVTLTTRTSDLVAALERAVRPLAVLGLRPERLGFVVAMTLRFVPLIRDRADQLREAQRARGVERAGTTLLLPLVVEVLRTADGVAEALEARGVSDV